MAVTKVTPASRLVVQSILFNTSPDALLETLRSLARAADFAIAGGYVSKVMMTYGDCSPHPVLSEDLLDLWRAECSEIAGVYYTYFNKNLGSARGHNTLAAMSAIEAATAADKSRDLILIMNPDVRVAPDALVNLIRTLQEPQVGLAEARQIPIEHPKDFDVASGDTSWASTACALMRRDTFEKLDGFDADSFFLYCDDVDFSWRVRLAGQRVVYDPSAVVFHDKRLSDHGAWVASSAERYYSAEAALILAHKWSRPELVSRYLGDFRANGSDHFLKAAAEYEKRREQGKLPEPLDPKHQVGTFIDGYYAPHRYKL